MIPKFYRRRKELEDTVHFIIDKFKESVIKAEKSKAKGKLKSLLKEAQERYFMVRDLAMFERDKHIGYLDSLMNKYKLPKKAKEDIIKEILRTIRTEKKHLEVDHIKSGLKEYIDELKALIKKK